MRLSEMLSQAAGSDVDAAKKARKMATDLVTKMSKTQRLLEQASSLMKQNADDLDSLRSVAFKMLGPDEVKKIKGEVKLLHRLPKELVKVTVQFSAASHGLVQELPIYLNQNVIYKK